MKKIINYIFYSFIVIVILLFCLIMFKKTTIYAGSYIIQDKLNDDDKYEKKVYVFLQEKFDVNSIKSIKIEYKNGYKKYSKDFLRFEEGIWQLKNIDLEGLEVSKNKVFIIGPKINLLNYMISNIK
ncbi:hypothetical protein [Spiroplasma tabanidicola]|nr:hypothetical protein [Spiroplasma tabanidicola]